jgi:NodT family efflux transporter outer membrane factor (OMF) lipoprotein
MQLPNNRKNMMNNRTRFYILVLQSVLLLGGCTKLGPDFVKPETPVENDWSYQNDEVVSQPVELDDWWTVFNDPALNRIVDMAYRQNLPLQVAGLRIYEARAQLGIAVGLQFPQQQRLTGSATTNRISENSPNFIPQTDTNFRNYQAGFDAAWELDFWGRFRRNVEAADANLATTVADYDNALVSLTAEAARIYVTIRTLEERLQIAYENIRLQQESLNIASVRFKYGATTELDVTQAQTNLADTQALVPVTQKLLQQAKNALSTLLGMPPSDLSQLLGGSGTIPVAPAEVMVGIPTELLRRRPDIRQAEQLAAERSALIGVARADLFPSFSLFGTIGYQSSDTRNSDAGDLFDSDSLTLSAGPAFSWNILNYGRLRNNVRVQDARYQQTIVNYRDTVLNAYREAEDAMVAFVQSREESKIRETGTTAAKRSSKLSAIQYREGAVDFQRVVDSDRALVLQQDQWASSRGDIALGLIAIYKALGGGWETRAGDAVISDENRAAMQERTNWGGLLDPEAAEEGSGN